MVQRGNLSQQRDFYPATRDTNWHSVDRTFLDPAQDVRFAVPQPSPIHSRALVRTILFSVQKTWTEIVEDHRSSVEGLCPPSRQRVCTHCSPGEWRKQDVHLPVAHSMSTKDLQRSIPTGLSSQCTPSYCGGDIFQLWYVHSPFLHQLVQSLTIHKQPTKMGEAC
jgi:hypothetical protein